MWQTRWAPIPLATQQNRFRFLRSATQNSLSIIIGAILFFFSIFITFNDNKRNGKAAKDDSSIVDRRSSAGHCGFLKRFVQ